MANSNQTTKNDSSKSSDTRSTKDTSKSKGTSKTKDSMNSLKMEAAQELGVPMSKGYNGNLTSAQNGSVGGKMVQKMIKKQESQMSDNN